MKTSEEETRKIRFEYIIRQLGDDPKLCEQVKVYMERALT